MAKKYGSLRPKATKPKAEKAKAESTVPIKRRTKKDANDMFNMEMALELTKVKKRITALEKGVKTFLSPSDLESSLNATYGIPLQIDRKEHTKLINEKLVKKEITADEAYFLIRIKRDTKLLGSYYNLIK